MTQRKKIATVVGLCVLLVGVLVGGVLLLNRGRTQGETLSGGDASSVQQFQRIRVHERREEVEPENTTQRYAPFFCQGEACLFSCRPDGQQIQVVRAADGELVKQYDIPEFPEQLEGLCLDGQENLWYVFQNDQRELMMAQCGTVQREPQKVWNLPSGGSYQVNGFWIWENYAVLQCLNSENGDNTIVRYDLQTKEVKTGTVAGYETKFCADGEGYLYVLEKLGEASWEMKKCDLRTGAEQWAQQGFIFPWTLYSDGDTIYVLEMTETAFELRQADASTGELRGESLNFETDLDTPLDRYHYLNIFTEKYILVREGQVTLCQIGQNGEDGPYERLTLSLEPYTVEVKPEDIVTLTITAPYPQESVQKAIRMYQKEHPEVQVEWDTQYLTREEYVEDSLNYKDQIAARTMAGNVGDLQMITGAALSQDVITDTDAFTDLTAYLEGSPIRDELEWNFLEPLRGEDGALRAVPLGVSYESLIYNTKLLRELGNPIDPNTVTWSELLDLALQWKEEGRDLSLFLANYGYTDTTILKENLLTRILLANLYGEDSLKSPEFRALLEKLQALWESPQLIGQASVEHWWYDSNDYDRMLFGFKYLESGYANIIPALGTYENFFGLEIQIAPVPKGETYQKQQSYAFCWGIPSSSEKKDLAWSLLEFMLSENGMPDGVYRRGFDSINNQTLEKLHQLAQFEMNGPDISVFHEQLKALREVPISRYDEPYGWVDAVYNPILDYMNGKKTLDEALSLATSNWDRYLLS